MPRRLKPAPGVQTVAMARWKLGGWRGESGAVFSQWISGQPWWLTVLMLPVWIVLACIGFVLKQIGLAVLIVAVVGAAGVLVWRVRRRLQSATIKPDTTLP